MNDRWPELDGDRERLRLRRRKDWLGRAVSVLLVLLVGVVLYLLMGCCR